MIAFVSGDIISISALRGDQYTVTIETTETTTTTANTATTATIATSWDELSSHQAEAVSLNLASRYGYITTVNHGEGAIKAQVGFNLCFDAISGNRENFDFNHLHQQFLGS